MSEPIKVFMSYAHEDQELREELAKHLRQMQRDGTIEQWADCDIKAGDRWANQIDENLEQAQIILLLISPDFMNSDYCCEKEMTRALELDAENKATVIPVILRPTDMTGAAFAELQALPRGAKPVVDWPNADSAFVDVVAGIRKAIREREAAKAPLTIADGARSSKNHAPGRLRLVKRWLAPIALVCIALCVLLAWLNSNPSYTLNFRFFLLTPDGQRDTAIVHTLAVPVDMDDNGPTNTSLDKAAEQVNEWINSQVVSGEIEISATLTGSEQGKYELDFEPERTEDKLMRVHFWQLDPTGLTKEHKLAETFPKSILIPSDGVLIEFRRPGYQMEVLQLKSDQLTESRTIKKGRPPVHISWYAQSDPYEWMPRLTGAFRDAGFGVDDEGKRLGSFQERLGEGFDLASGQNKVDDKVSDLRGSFVDFVVGVSLESDEDD